MPEEIQEWPRSTRWIHAGFALAVTLLLFSELDMKAIWKKVGELPFRHLLFHMHMWIGMFATVIVVAFWAQVFSNKNLRSHLFPYSGPYLDNVCTDIRGLANRKLPPSGMRGGVPGMVHGFGLAAVTGMALLGFIMFFLIPNYGVAAPIGFYQLPKKMHDFLSSFVWLYWWGHIGMATLHASKSPAILRVFRP
ncbi:MAG: cytochrome b/b6 domain-containing protein [Acidithiobacillus sp.]|uniref:Cytochrome b/b6 domain-containing protein n=1 Tax=Acidithiobacillus ferruginosus TaxID=3063951 RepID=A0ACD5IIA0_9PROT|nr:cytochrome b/b6 domain-containing protein [Acidithiobacillus ferruginosus]MBU2813503.1 cytochrome b/b6 domain-containing protein [Acidithiobacillus ferruginosus]